MGKDPRGFQFVRPQQELLGQDVLLIVRRRSGPEPMVEHAPYYQRIRPVEMVPLWRGRDAAFPLSVYLGQRLLAPVPPERLR